MQHFFLETNTYTHRRGNRVLILKKILQTPFKAIVTLRVSGASYAIHNTLYLTIWDNYHFFRNTHTHTQGRESEF